MKKITFLFLICLPLIGFAQKVYDFTGSANPGSWIAAGNGTSVTPSANGLVFEFNAGTPRIDITRAADPFDVSVGGYMLVTLINNNTEAGSFGGFFDKNDGISTGIQFLSFQTGMTQASSPGNGVEATYVFKLQSANYNNDLGNGTLNDTDNIANMEYVGIRFKAADGTSALSGDSATNGNIILKKIEIVDPGVVSKASYNFANDNIAGFAGITGGSISYTGSALSFTGDGSNTAPKFAQQFFGIDASSYQYVHVVVDNNTSNADQMKFQFVDGSSNVQTYGNQALSAGASVIDMNLSGKTEWTGTITDWRIVFSNGTSIAIDTNPVTVSSIVFDNSPTLGVSNFNKAEFAMYPNPTKGTLYFKSSSKISNISVFDLTGKQVLHTSRLVQNTLDISVLKSGVYMVTMQTADNLKGTKKLVIE